jgi:hypothetical protein
VRETGIIFSYVLVATLLIGMLVLGEAGYAAIVGVLLLGLTLVLFADFTKLKVGGGGFGVEAERLEKHQQAMKDAARNVDRESDEQVQRVREELTAIPEARGVLEPLLAMDATTDEASHGFRTRLQNIAKEGEARRREQIERLIAEAAQWGYEMAAIGFKTPPRPVIEWTPEGEPQILYGEGGR